ncbi:MAG TPA: NAD-dependent epimerase/dehydratase family protein [Gemmatimonadaceae bacterium]
MIAVVTGASGFIGRNLVRRLLSRGAEVRCLVRPRGGRAPEGAAAFPVSYDDQRSLDRCHAFDGADVVFHLGGATRAVGERQFERANVAPTRMLLRAITERRAGPRFVYVSSQSAAGPAAPGQSVTEDDAPAPREAYGRSKLAAERVVQGFSDRVSTTIVRPCAVFGPWDSGFLALFRLARAGWLIYPGVERHEMSLLYVDDVVDGLVSAAREKAAIGRTYFLASRSTVTWGQLGQHISAALGVSPRAVNLPIGLVSAASVVGEWVGRLTGTAPLLSKSRAVLAAQPRWVCSGSRAGIEIHFNPARALPDAIRETYLWYVQSGWMSAARGAAPASPASQS